MNLRLGDVPMMERLLFYDNLIEKRREIGMENYELYYLIDLPTEIIHNLKLVSEEIDLQSIDCYLNQLMDIKTAAAAYQYFINLWKEDGDNLKMLYCQLECARRAFDKYEQKHISPQIYKDTMKCFTRFLEECKKKNGRMFLIEVGGLTGKSA